MEYFSLILFTLLTHQSHGLAIPTPQDQLKLSGKVFFYGSEKENLDNSLCAVGEVPNVDGTCNPSSGESNRNWSFYAGATKHGESSKTTPRPKMKYDIVVIHSNEKKHEDPIIIPPPAEKNVVVVLRKGPKEKAPRIIEASTLPPLSPEVHFIDYKEGSNMLLPGGIDLKSALAGAPFMANRIKSGFDVSIPKSQIKSSDETKINFSSEDAKMKANFDRFVRSNMEKNTEKSFKDIVYDYILEANLSDNDPEINNEHIGEVDDITEKTVFSTIQVSDDVLKASNHFGSSVDNIKDLETNIEENNAAIMETTAMTPLDVVKNKEAAENKLEQWTESPQVTKIFLGEPLSREFSTEWKGITNSYKETMEISTEKSNRPTSTERRVLPTVKSETVRKHNMKNSEPVNSEPVNQFVVPNQSSPPATKVSDIHINKNHNLESDAEVIQSDKTSVNDNEPIRSDKIVPEIETFFRELLKGANPGLDTNKYDYIIKEMSKIVAESNIFKTQLQKLKKDDSESRLPDPSLQKNIEHNQNNSNDSSKNIKLDHKFEAKKIRIPYYQETKRTQLSNNINKSEQSVHSVKDAKMNPSNVPKSDQGKGVVKRREQDDLLIIPKYSNNRPSSQQIGSSYNRFMSSYLNSYPNLKSSNGNSDKDSTTKAKEFSGKVGSISKTFADGWRGMEFTASNPEKVEEDRKVPKSEYSNTRNNNYSENMKVKKYEDSRHSDLRAKEHEENNQHDNKLLNTSNHTNNEQGLLNAIMQNSAAPQFIEEGRAFSNSNYGNSHDQNIPSHVIKKQIGNAKSQPSAKTGIEKGKTEKIKNASELDSSDQSEIDFRLKSSFLEKQQIKDVTSGDIVYGKQQTSEPKIRSPVEQISNQGRKNADIVKQHDNEFNNFTQVNTKVNDEESTVEGVKYIIEKIMSAKPFESGHKIIPALEEQSPLTDIVHNKNVSEVTTGAEIAKHLDRDTRTSTEANKPFQHFHKMVTISLGINITDPNSMKGDTYGTSRAIIIKPQLATTSSFDDKKVDKPLNKAILKSTLTNQLQNYPVSDNLKKEIIARPEINLNNKRINEVGKRVRNATKFTIDEVKANPYSSPVYSNHSNEYEWKPLDKSRNETEPKFVSPLGELSSMGPKGEVFSSTPELGRHGKKQEPITLFNSSDKLHSVVVGAVLGSQKNVVKSPGNNDEPPRVRNGQSSRLKKESKPLTISEESKEHSLTRGPQHEEPPPGRPWLKVAIRL